MSKESKDEKIEIINEKEIKKNIYKFWVFPNIIRKYILIYLYSNLNFNKYNK